MKARNTWIALALLVAGVVAHAADLGTAKSQGWVGEQQDGFLGLVRQDAPADVRALVADVNKQRRAQLAQIAGRTGVTPEDAARVFAKEAFERTAAGNYVQDASGAWVRK